MKYIKYSTLFLLAILVSFGSMAGIKKDQNKTAEDVFLYASKIEVFNKETAKALKIEMKSLTKVERKRLIVMAKEDAKLEEGSTSTGLYILAVIIPPVAVGIYTGWDIRTLYSLLWTLLFWLPGVIHAFLIFGK